MTAGDRVDGVGADATGASGVRPLPPPPVTPPGGDDVDFSRGDPEEFPIAALPTILAAVATNLAEVYQVPVCMPAMSMLAVLSGGWIIPSSTHRAR